MLLDIPNDSDYKESTCNAGDLGWEDPLEKGMAIHSSILAWRILRIEEPGGLQSVGSLRIWHDRATNTFVASSSHRSISTCLCT